MRSRRHPWGVLGRGGVTRFETLQAALAYYFAIVGVQLVCQEGVSEWYTKILKPHAEESRSLLLRRDELRRFVEAG